MTQVSDWTEQESTVEQPPDGEHDMHIVRCSLTEEGDRMFLNIADSQGREALVRVWLGLGKPDKFGDFVMAEVVRAVGADPKAMAAKGHTPQTLSSDRALKEFWLGKALRVRTQRRGEYVNVTKLFSAVTEPTTGFAAPPPPTAAAAAVTLTKVVSIASLEERFDAAGKRFVRDGKELSVWALVSATGERFGIVNQPNLVKVAQDAKAAGAQVQVDHVADGKGFRVTNLIPQGDAADPAPVAEADIPF